MLAITMTSLRQADAAQCEQETFEGAGYIVCTVDADKADLRLFWKNADTAKPEGSAGQVPNFFKKPNGIFSIGDAGASILPTDEFLKRRQSVRFATQSGPMLVIGNKLNPIFLYSIVTGGAHLNE
ncbi:hypothetical protein CUJ84_Chr002929 [Rhizobium leguminosarum]|uniref:Uncharacterized protein n=1 Tax=Rhizobium leguminosarum TaxID=384 RepID=A0A2K9Z4V1_RHILE|nr:hypothetical protein CUJ84_Chr002929 [Rhizobium leguminosarum]